MVSKNGERSPIPAYVAYKTFKEFVRDLPDGAQAAVDEVVWNARFGDRTAAQLAAALKFLGLIQVNGNASAICLSLAVGSEEERRRTLTHLIEGRYGDVLGILANGSVKDLEFKFRESFGVGGDTVRRCITFLLHAAADLNLPVSPGLMRGRRSVLPDDRLWRTTALSSTAEEVEGGLDEPSVTASRQRDDELNHLDPALRGLLLKLPAGRSLTIEEKKSWKLALEAVLDLIYPTAAAPGKAALAH